MRRISRMKSNTNLENPFSRVRALRDLALRRVFEIIDDSGAILAEIALVNGLTTPLEEDQAVELVEELARRLVDGHQE